MNRITDVCYEQIKDSFYYGRFGPFEIIIDTDTGFFNATKLCSAGGKQFKHWHERQISKDFISYLENGYLKGKEVMKYVHGGFSQLSHKISGTYVTQELIVDIATWISFEFKLNVFFIVQDFVQSRTRKEAEIEIAYLKNEIHKVIQNTGKYRDDIVIKTKERKKQNMLMIIEKNADNDNYKDATYKYYVIRCQRENLCTALNKLRKRYPALEIIYVIEYNPNSINLLNRIKEEFRNQIKYNANHIAVYDISHFIYVIENKLIRTLPDLLGVAKIDIEQL